MATPWEAAIAGFQENTGRSSEGLQLSPNRCSHRAHVLLSEDSHAADLLDKLKSENTGKLQHHYPKIAINLQSFRLYSNVLLQDYRLLRHRQSVLVYPS
jgi:hypothetical protein